MRANPNAVGPDLRVELDGSVLRVTFDRPRVRNAATVAMYEGLYGACERADEDETVRVMVLRGAGGEAFVAGTDIGEFIDFDGSRGVAYERRISEVLGRLMAVRVPVVAVVDGFCIGGGLLIAAAADLRVADRSARFGVPVARTLGNTVSASSYALLVRHFGASRTTDMLMSARLLAADEVALAGFAQVVDDPSATAADLVRSLVTSAPLTLSATKELSRRLHESTVHGLHDEDVVSRVYGSADFAAGVAAFGDRRQVRWQGH